MKCPVCKKKADKLFAEQTYSTTAMVELNEKKEVTFVDLEAGYTLLDEWIAYMLSANGKPRVSGCPNCMAGETEIEEEPEEE